MTLFLSLFVTGLVTGAIYALISAGLVVTYTTTGVFNFAHGAVGMACAFIYYTLSQDWHIPGAVSLLLILFVIAPLIGLVIERVLMRGLTGAPVDLMLVITLGLLLFLVGGANILYKPTVTRNLFPYFYGHGFRVSTVLVTWDDVIVFACLVAVAIGLRVFFYRTRTGIAMRAVVDSPDLLAMSGGRPVRIQQLAWAMGCSLAGLAGVLIAQITLLNILSLTLLVLDGYAAAIIGRLRSLPIAIGGALAIGIGNALLQGYVTSLNQVTSIVPLVVLFLALIALPQDRLRSANFARTIAPRVASLRSSLGGAVALVLVAIVLAQFLSSTNLQYGSQALAVGLLLLSLVLLTGYGGMISLCQMALAGIGAVVMSDVGGTGGSLLGLLAAAATCAAVGGVLALPTLRLRGLYFALATFSFAAMMEQIGFNKIMGIGGSVAVARPHFPGIPTQSDSAFFIFCAVVFAVAAVGLLALRRGSFGRRLVAINDSPAACATLGISVNRTKLAAFVLSSGLAGIAGALYEASFGTAQSADFAALVSLVVLLLARVGGINTATGALVGGVFFEAFAIVHSYFPQNILLGELQYLLTGFAAVSVGRDPNGFGGRIEQLADLLGIGRGRASAVEPVVATDAAGTPAAAFLSSDDELAVSR